MAIDSDLNNKMCHTIYPLYTPQGVYTLLSNIHYLKNARFYHNDLNACVILMDLFTAGSKVKFTLRQKEALYYVFMLDLSQSEAARLMNCSQQGVQQHIWVAVKKIAKHFSRETEAKIC